MLDFILYRSSFSHIQQFQTAQVSICRENYRHTHHIIMFRMCLTTELYRIVIVVFSNGFCFKFYNTVSAIAVTAWRRPWSILVNQQISQPCVITHISESSGFFSIFFSNFRTFWNRENHVTTISSRS